MQMLQMHREIWIHHICRCNALISEGIYKLTGLAGDRAILAVISISIGVLHSFVFLVGPGGDLLRRQLGQRL